MTHSRSQIRPSDTAVTSFGWAHPSSPARFDHGDYDVSRGLRVAVEHVSQALLILGEAGEVLVANRAAETIFGYPAGRLVGQRIERLFPDSLQGEHDPRWKLFWLNPGNQRLGIEKPLNGLRSDGAALPLEVSLRVLVEGRMRFVIASLVDVSDRVTLEARLVAATTDQSGINRLVADLAGRFVNIEPDAVDEAICDSLRQIGEVLQLDRICLWRISPNRGTIAASHCWTPDGEGTTPEEWKVASIPYTASRLEAGEATWFASLDQVPSALDREAYEREGLRSVAAVPLASGDEARCLRRALFVGSTRREHEWMPAVSERLRLIAGVFGLALARKASQMALQDALEELQRLRERVEDDAVHRPGARVDRRPCAIVSDSAAVQEVLAQLEQVAPTPATVLLLGETGAGKEVFAQAIHDLSPRHHRQMVRVNCSAIPSALIESELFGRERGAFTGAITRQIGRFEAGNHSTLFLDEIGELPAEVQIKLLRVLQDRVIERLGSSQPIKIDVRIIAATNRNLEQAVADGAFREDLFYRLNVFPIAVPPLRDRIEDIPGLVWEFIDEFSRSFGKPIESITKESMRQLQSHPWPGNVRELRNVIERAVIVAQGPRLTVQVPQPALRRPQAAMTLANLELEHIRATLESTNWRIRGAGGAAERLGLKPTTLESRIARLGLVRPVAS